MFSTRLHYNGEFTKFPGRKFMKGKVKYIDLSDSDTFCVHEIDEGKLLYYHFKKPFLDLDVGLYVLGSDSDINHFSTFVPNHKLIDIYTEHGKTMLHTYFLSPNPSRVKIEEVIEPRSIRLMLEWKNSKTGDQVETWDINLREIS